MMIKSGFTLIELLIVVGIIGILSAIAIPSYRDAAVRSRVAQVQMDLRTVGTALQTYQVDHNLFPRQDDQFHFFALYLLPDLTSPIPYLNTTPLKDPFGWVEEFVPPKDREGESGGLVANEYVLQRDSYTYIPYYNYGIMRGLPTLSKEGYALASIGPDKQDTYIVDYPFPEFRRLPVDSVNDLVYNPSNGIVSPGDIAYFGGDLPVQGLIGGR